MRSALTIEPVGASVPDDTISQLPQRIVLRPSRRRLLFLSGLGVLMIAASVFDATVVAAEKSAVVGFVGWFSSPIDSAWSSIQAASPFVACWAAPDIAGIKSTNSEPFESAHRRWLASTTTACPSTEDGSAGLAPGSGAPSVSTHSSPGHWTAEVSRWRSSWTVGARHADGATRAGPRRALSLRPVFEWAGLNREVRTRLTVRPRPTCPF